MAEPANWSFDADTHLQCAARPVRAGHPRR